MEAKYSKKIYRLTRSVLAVAMKVVYHPEVIGKENIPKEGPFILAGNHKSLLDIPLVATASKKEIRFIAKEELFQNKVSSYILKILGAIPIKRNTADMTAIRNSIKLLKNNEILGIFPEGTRNKKNTVQEFKAGAAMLAVKGNCPIIPFGISGEYKIGKKIMIQFGEAIHFQRNDLKENVADHILEDKVKQLLLK